MSDSILSRAFERFEAMENDGKFEMVRQAVISIKDGGDVSAVGREQAEIACELLARCEKVRKNFAVEASRELMIIAGKASPAQAAL